MVRISSPFLSLPLGKYGLVVLFLVGSSFGDPVANPAPAEKAPTVEDLFRLLDADGDSKVSPYEGADGLLRLLEQADVNTDGEVDLSELHAALEGSRTQHDEELAQAFREIDVDGDQRISIETEVPEEYQSVARDADSNQDGLLSLEEFASIEDGDESPESEVAQVFSDFDRNRDGKLSRDEIPEEERQDLLRFADTNADGFVSKAELESALRRENQSATFAVDGKRCFMTGVIGPRTPSRVLELICEHPEVKVIVMQDVPGSMDDSSNLRAARMIRKHGLATQVPSDGVIASGGVDFFLAGQTRSLQEGAKLGVHSWGDGDFSGARFPREHPLHRPYLDFYRDMGVPTEFYWYTLEAAPPESVHWMTPAECQRFRVESPKSASSRGVPSEG